MLQTAEIVAKRYEIPREAQDRYGAQSQQRASAAQEAGQFKDEIAPITVAWPASIRTPDALLHASK